MGSRRRGCLTDRIDHTLASTLVAVDERREFPREDLQAWSDAFAVFDVVPMLAPDAPAWPFPTHPPTAERGARLQRLTAALETE